SCAGCNDDSTGDASTSQASQLPQLSPATGLNLAAACESFAGKLSFANTSITAISTVAAGTLSVGGNAVPEHCLVTGTMNTRVSPVDGKTYAIGFEMRLPKAWNGRFYYQANGGLDGSVATALGALGGGPISSALGSGFAVISSDAGHNGSQVPLFGR
ncbi:tannase/feruloyl esterase family alpha/beta hydrolase, partial [Pseudomonas sp. 58(2021)]